MSEKDSETRNAVLLKVSRGWKPPEGFDVKQKYGQFVKGLASEDVLKELDRDPDVLSHEIDLATGRFY